jgi:YggT family protein
MAIFQSIFGALSALIKVYSAICLIRIVLSWVPEIEYSPVGKFIAGICDPFLNWFRRFSFTRVGVVDFSPILALGVLSVGSMIFTRLSRTGTISIGIVVASLIQVAWSFFSFLLTIIIIFLAIRLIYDLMNRYGYSPFWTMLDKFLNPPIAWVTSLLGGGRKPLPYRTSLIVTLIFMLVLRIGLEFGVGYLIQIIANTPL